MSPEASSRASWTTNCQAKRSRSSSLLSSHPVQRLTGMNFLAVVALLAFAPSIVSAVCEDVESYLNLPADLGGDMTIEVPSDVGEIACAAPELLEINGGTLTLTSINTVRFVNLRINVRSGAGLILDFPQTEIGPEDNNVDNETGSTLTGFAVEEGASLVFNGFVTVDGVEDNGRVFGNYGSIEFKDDAVFENVRAGVIDNYARLRFRGSATFRNNLWSALDNVTGTVRFAGETVFHNNGAGFFEGPGSAVSNREGGIVIFDQDALFTENESLHLGGAVHNTDSKIKFYGKAYFFDNLVNDGKGGGLYSESGDVRFKGATQFIGNIAREEGGGIAVDGGDMRFEKFVTIEGNDASDTGGGMWVTEAAIVDFRKPDRVNISGNTVQAQGGCLGVDASADSTIIGYTGIDGDLCGGLSE